MEHQEQTATDNERYLDIYFAKIDRAGSVYGFFIAASILWGMSSAFWFEYVPADIVATVFSHLTSAVALGVLVSQWTQDRYGGRDSSEI